MSHEFSSNRPLPSSPRAPLDTLPSNLRTKEFAPNQPTPSQALRSLWRGLVDVPSKEIIAFRGGIMGNAKEVQNAEVGMGRKRAGTTPERLTSTVMDSRDVGEGRKRRKDENRRPDVQCGSIQHAPSRNPSTRRSKKPRIATAPQFTLSAPRNRRRTPDAEIATNVSSHHLRFDNTTPRLLPPTSKFTFRVDPSLDSFPIPPAQLPPPRNIASIGTPLRPTYQRRTILRETNNDSNIQLPRQREASDFVQDVFFNENSRAFNVVHADMKAEERKALDRKRILDLEDQVKALKRELSARPKIPLRTSSRNPTKSPVTICASINAAIRPTPKKSSNLATPLVPPESYSTSIPTSFPTLHYPVKEETIETVYGEALSTDETIRLPLPPGSISPFVVPPSRIPLRPLVLSSKASRVYAPLPSRRGIQHVGKNVDEDCRLLDSMGERTER